VILGMVMLGLCIFQHRANIKRLLNGTENKFSTKKKK
jgi:glycerol-3-phosphate acyltransferase PlsY